MTEIFISYSRKNTSFVNKLVQALEKHHLSVWVDREDIRGGTAWRAAISNAIRSCTVLIVVLSEQSILSDNVAKELVLAEKHKKTIIPIWYQFCEIPPIMEYQLAGLQIIDFSGQSFNAAVEQLISALSDTDISYPQETKSQGTKISTTVKRKLSLSILTRKPYSKRLVLLGIAGLLLLGIGTFVLFSPLIFGAGKDLSGRYTIQGHDFDCVEYAGKVTISQSGRIYLVEGESWWMDGSTRSKGGGVGVLDGDIFTINWGVDEGKTSYRVQSDGSLSVMWVDYATSCIPGEELTPK